MLQLEGVSPRSACLPFELAELPKPVFYREHLTSGRRNGQEFSIRLAHDDIDRTCASEIINRVYGRRGYGSSHQLLARSECLTFTACCDDEMIGTLTLRVDSPNQLIADETFPDEMARLRNEPRASLCELTKFAFDPAPDSRPQLAKLFHVIFVYGTQRFACSDLVIEVNPRHVRFYETMLGFARIGALRTNESVIAPSQLMHLAVSHIGEKIALNAGAGPSASRSLYPYFFGKSEEQALRQRINANGTDRQMLTLRHMGDQDAAWAGQRRLRTAQRKRAAA